MDGIVEAQNIAAQTLFSVNLGAKIKDLSLSENALTVLQKEISRLTCQADKDISEPPKLFRLEIGNDDTPLLIAISLWKSAGGRQFIILKTTNIVWPEHLTPLVEKAFDLTSAESNIVKLIVEGQSVDDIAQTRGTSVKTVRFQIRSIYDKTYTNSQSEFIRMAIGLTTLDLVDKNTLIEPARPISKMVEAYPYPEHRQLLSLPDGRILDYADFGPKNGKPCVFFHNGYYGDIFPARLALNLIKNNLRMIIPARPYYARSSAPPRNTISHVQNTEDLELLMQSLGIEKAVHLAQTAGCLFSFAYAKAHPGKVAAIVGVAPMLPFNTLDGENDMPKFSRFLSSVVHRYPKMLDYVCRAGNLYRQQIGSKRFLETVLCQSVPDRKIANDPNNLDAILRGFHFCTDNWRNAFLYDYKNFPKDQWGDIINISCPIYTIIGSDENSSRHARAQRLIEAGANIEIVTADDGGELLFFSHPDAIVDTLLKAWEHA
jgi:pimeloyl-ACP methyl ester carboxylesterase/DNA-binding CsgD family transcriptional regulator